MPESLRDDRDIWIGSLNPHNPQVEVTSGPDVDTVSKAHQVGERIVLRLASRVADMHDEEPSDDKGEVEVIIEELFEDRPHRTLCFLARGDLPLVGESCIWVWEYDDRGEGGADLLVAD